MDDSSWLDACRQRGQLNETDVKKWVAARTEQIRNSALLLSLSPALAIVSILCILTILLIIGLALKRRAIQLRHYAFLINQQLVDLLTLSILIVVGCTTELRDAFNSIGFLVFLTCVFSFTNVGLSQVFNSLLCFLRHDCQSFYAKLRVEYVLTACILLWFICAVCALTFSPLFFVLEFAQKHGQQDCMFYSCQSPLLLSFLLAMAIIWFANLTTYSLTLSRVYKQKKRQNDDQNDVPLAEQIFQQHWLSIWPVVLFTVTGALTLFIVAGLAHAIFEMHQLRQIHMQCQMEMRLDLISQMQTLGSALLMLWILRSAIAPLALLSTDFKNLLGNWLSKNGGLSQDGEQMKIHCCLIDRVSWCKTV